MQYKQKNKKLTHLFTKQKKKKEKEKERRKLERKRKTSGAVI